MTKKITKEFTLEEIREIKEALDYVSGFVGVVNTIAFDDENKWSDLHPLGLMAEEKLMPLRDTFQLMEKEAEDRLRRDFEAGQNIIKKYCEKNKIPGPTV